MICRHCTAPLEHTFLDLGSAPPSNAYLSDETLRSPEVWYPLRLLVCTQCWLVQTEDHSGQEALFTDEYAYFSSYSSSWLQHAQRYVREMTTRFALNAQSNVAEVAANDGYLLRYVQAAGIPCYGIEPTASTAQAARKLDIDIVQRFFGVELALELAVSARQVDLAVANNVLAHVPDINDFVAGFTVLLKPTGVATFEFPHLASLVAQSQFDTVYHEHFSYLSLTSVTTIFAANGLSVFDVQKLPSHGGSLRVFAQRTDTGGRDVEPAVAEMLKEERNAGMQTLTYYRGFQVVANRVKNEFQAFLIDAAFQGKRVAAYGAAAKGCTLLNYAGVRPDLLSFVADRNPAKIGKYLPGSRIPIVDETRLRAWQPDYVVLLPWNLKTELLEQLRDVRDWDGQFVVAVPNLELL